MNVLRYAKLVDGDTSDSTHLYHVERPEGHFLLYFQGGSSLSYDAKATGDETEVARAFDQDLANLESGTYHNETWEVESETFDAEAEKRLKIFDHPTWGIKWGQVGGAPTDEAQFCDMLEKQIREWKGSTHGMPVASHPYWPTFHAMVMEAVTEQYGDPVRLYRGIHGDQAADILSGEPVSMYRFSAWTSDLSSARVYAAGKTKRGNLDWVVVQRDFSPSEIMFAPVAFSGPCEQPDILMELMHDVEHYGDEFIVSLPKLVPGDYKVAAKPKGMRERALREYVRALLEAGELGRQVFADRAPDGRHYGTERDTEIESTLWQTLRGYMGSGTNLFKQDTVDLILQLAQDPQYNDVFIRHASGDVYRGMAVDSWWLDERVPDWGDYEKRGKWSEVISANFELKPKSSSPASSWTTDESMGEMYGREDGEGQYGVVLIADSSSGDFLDLSELYRYHYLSDYDFEKETIGLGTITVKGIKVYPRPRSRR